MTSIPPTDIDDRGQDTSSNASQAREIAESTGLSFRQAQRLVGVPKAQWRPAHRPRVLAVDDESLTIIRRMTVDDAARTLGISTRTVKRRRAEMKDATRS